MNAPYARLNLAPDQKSGPADSAGPSSIFTVSRNGRLTKDPYIQDREIRSRRMAPSFRLLASGDVPAVTCLKTLFPRGILVGVRRRWISDRSLASHPIHVASHALDQGRDALILVIPSVMLAPVLPVRPWAPYKAATAEDTKSRRNA